MFWTLLWLFSPALDAIKFTLQVGFSCPSVVMDTTNLGATKWLPRPYALTILNLSPTQ